MDNWTPDRWQKKNASQQPVYEKKDAVDEVYQRLAAGIQALQNAHAEIGAFVEKGSIIEDY